MLFTISSRISLKTRPHSFRLAPRPLNEFRPSLLLNHSRVPNVNQIALHLNNPTCRRSGPIALLRLHHGMAQSHEADPARADYVVTLLHHQALLAVKQPELLKPFAAGGKYFPLTGLHPLQHGRDARL